MITEPYDRIFPLPAYTERDRKIQRLSVRGRDLSVKLEMRGVKRREHWDGRSTSQWFADFDQPIWRVRLPARFMKAQARAALSEDG